MSGRTFARLIVAETGMSFGRWRRQLDIILAIRWMAAERPSSGSPATSERQKKNESVGSFVTMFRRPRAPRRAAAWRVGKLNPVNEQDAKRRSWLSSARPARRAKRQYFIRASALQPWAI